VLGLFLGLLFNIVGLIIVALMPMKPDGPQKKPFRQPSEKQIRENRRLADLARGTERRDGWDEND
jgi:hypothetical protein